MNKKQYADYRKNDHWKTIRKLRKDYDGNKCVICGSSQNLEVHHTNYKNINAEQLQDLITVCRDCHQQIHGYKNTVTKMFKPKWNVFGYFFLDHFAKTGNDPDDYFYNPNLIEWVYGEELRGLIETTQSCTPEIYETNDDVIYAAKLFDLNYGFNFEEYHVKQILLQSLYDHRLKGSNPKGLWFLEQFIVESEDVFTLWKNVDPTFFDDVLNVNLEVVPMSGETCEKCGNTSYVYERNGTKRRMCIYCGNGVEK